MASIALLGLTLLWLGHLAVERVLLERRRRAVALRIAVTGTRGKTSVARMLAAVLRVAGRRVLAKTTGSAAAYVLPDGGEEVIRRRGRPSIIEQKRLLRRAAELRADTVVAEIMSIHRENHRVEAQALLRPHIVLVTNFRVDHIEAQGSTPAEVASVLALDVPPRSTAYVLDSEWHAAFATCVGQGDRTLVRVPAGSGTADGIAEFPENTDLVFAVARSLGIADDDIRAGIRAGRGDIGTLAVWRYPRPGGREPWLVANAFAANDPESTLRILDRLSDAHRIGADACVGLLCLRADRGDRTVLWAESLKAGSLARFRRLYVSGMHARALRHRLRRAPGADRIRLLAPREPVKMMEHILEAEGDAAAMLFGFGNIGGSGERLVRHWRKAGESHGV